MVKRRDRQPAGSDKSDVMLEDLHRAWARIVALRDEKIYLSFLLAAWLIAKALVMSRGDLATALVIMQSASLTTTLVGGLLSVIGAGGTPRARHWKLRTSSHGRS